jgi:hypothetical protein
MTICAGCWSVMGSHRGCGCPCHAITTNSESEKEVKLLPCPFACGGAGTRRWEHDMGRVWFGVECGKCGVSAVESTDSKVADENWNRRAPLPSEGASEKGFREIATKVWKSFPSHEFISPEGFPAEVDQITAALEAVAREKDAEIERLNARIEEYDAPLDETIEKYLSEISQSKAEAEQLRAEVERYKEAKCCHDECAKGVALEKSEADNAALRKERDAYREVAATFFVRTFSKIEMEKGRELADKEAATLLDREAK